MPTHWQDLEFYVQDSWKLAPRVTLDYGARYSLLFNYYANDDKQTSFVPSLYNPALGTDPCNGLLVGPGPESLPGGGLQGRDGGSEPVAPGQQVRRDRAAHRHRVGRPRQRQDGAARAASAGSSSASA